jgi:hypothetical protein
VIDSKNSTPPFLECLRSSMQVGHCLFVGYYNRAPDYGGETERRADMPVRLDDIDHDLGADGLPIDAAIGT